MPAPAKKASFELIPTPHKGLLSYSKPRAFSPVPDRDKLPSVSSDGFREPCAKSDIIAALLLPQSTHILQPMHAGIIPL
ncbi:Uncharacterized protein HZ326_18906 [Fusarium oxysporum f. sp. albedinis]|nr:hypothetical protein HZ326_26119 [Fusarium oxysporum f. sp. albedinis]KAJ0138158.1 Uncharacterized protein HZ326_18906 [Fusarium oxysporum f. sp. albedinis]